MLFKKKSPQRESPLSASGIKAAATALGKTGNAAAAIRAGLRRSVDPALTVSMGGESVTVDNQFVWIVGSCGSGKSEMGLRWARQHAESGGKVSVITPYDRIVSQFLPSETVIVYGDRIDDQTRDAVMNPAASFVPIVLDYPQKLSTRWYSEILLSLDMLLRTDVDMIVIEECEVRGFGPDILRTLDLLRKKGVRVVFLIQNWSGDLLDRILPSDAAMIMRTVDHRAVFSDVLPWFRHDFPDFHIMSCLQPGEGFMVSMGRHGLFSVPYDPDVRPAMRPDAMRAARNLSEHHPPETLETHTARLDAVAKACGHRDWQSADGREKNRLVDRRPILGHDASLAGLPAHRGKSHEND